MCLRSFCSPHWVTGTGGSSRPQQPPRKLFSAACRGGACPARSSRHAHTAARHLPHVSSRTCRPRAGEREACLPQAQGSTLFFVPSRHLRCRYRGTMYRALSRGCRSGGLLRPASPPWSCSARGFSPASFRCRGTIHRALSHGFRSGGLLRPASPPWPCSAAAWVVFSILHVDGPRALPHRRKPFPFYRLPPALSFERYSL